MSVAHQAFFGDGDYSFHLTAPMIQELERKTGVAIGVLFARVFNRTFGQSDLHELIRCALIGGGTAPARAAALIATYVVDCPLIETYPLAVTIAETAWFGQPHKDKHP